MHARTNRSYNERVSITNYVRSSIPHCNSVQRSVSYRAKSDFGYDMGVVAASPSLSCMCFFFSAAVPPRRKHDNNKYISAAEGERK